MNLSPGSPEGQTDAELCEGQKIRGRCVSACKTHLTQKACKQGLRFMIFYFLFFF